MQVFHQTFSIFPSSQYHPQITATYLMDLLLEHFLFICIHICCRLFHIYEKLFFSDTIFSLRNYKCEILYFFLVLLY